VVPRTVFSPQAEKAVFFIQKNIFIERSYCMDYFENQEKQFFDYLEEMKKNDDPDYGMALAVI
jgi:hypothetical protein